MSRPLSPAPGTGSAQVAESCSPSPVRLSAETPRSGPEPPAASGPRLDAAARLPRSFEHLASLLLARRWRRLHLLTCLLAQIRQHNIFHRHVLHFPGGVEDRPICPYQECRLAVGVTGLDDGMHAANRCFILAWPNQSLVRLRNLLYIVRKLDMRCRENDEIVANALQIADDMRRQQHRQA